LRNEFFGKIAGNGTLQIRLALPSVDSPFGRAISQSGQRIAKKERTADDAVDVGYSARIFLDFETWRGCL
jgi:hypothetical protein